MTKGVTIGNSIYLVGGLTALDLKVNPPTATSTDTFQRFDVKGGRYESLPALPARLNHVVAAEYGGEIYVAGGRQPRDYSLGAFGRSRCGAFRATETTESLRIPGPRS